MDHTVVERSILSTLSADKAKIPVLLGECGSGRTSVLIRLFELLQPKMVQYIDFERIVTTPEGFLQQIAKISEHFTEFQPKFSKSSHGPREAFQKALSFLCDARSPSDEAVIFLLDEFFELRTFESFPGLRNARNELLEALSGSSNKFVLTTRYVARANRCFREFKDRFQLIYMPPLNVQEVASILSKETNIRTTNDINDLGDSVHALTNGKNFYVKVLVNAMIRMTETGNVDPISALVEQMTEGAEIYNFCRFSYERRLHRARGYGALKGILQILANEESLTLTEISYRLQRTPGSTKDYLFWLEDVDLINSNKKRYSFTDSMLRLWLRLYSRPTPPGDLDVAREVQSYAVIKLASLE